MRIPSAILGLIALAMVLVQPPAACATGGGTDAGLALGAAALNVLYTPCKAAVALGGMIAGGLVGTLTGGDTRAAYAVLVPAVGGTYMVTPAHLDGSRPLEFFGNDYADRPSPRARTLESSSIYEALY